MLAQVLHKFPALKRVLKRVRTGITGIPPVTHDAITKERIRDLLGKDKPTILEIGCNDGSNTRWFLDVFANPRIYCFEPDPRAAERYRNRIGHDPKVQLFGLALSATDGEATFYQSSGQPSADMPKGWDLSGSLRKPSGHLDAHPWCKFDSATRVKTRTLDGWSHEHGVDQIDFIWMDVQGAEIDVLKGGARSLKSTRFLYTGIRIENCMKARQTCANFFAS